MPNKPAKSSERQKKKIFTLYIEESYLQKLLSSLEMCEGILGREYMNEYKPGRALELNRLIETVRHLRARFRLALARADSPARTGMVGFDRVVTTALNRIKRNKNGSRNTRPVPEHNQADV